MLERQPQLLARVALSKCLPSRFDGGFYRVYFINSGSGPVQLNGFHLLQYSAVRIDAVSQQANAKPTPVPPTISLRLIRRLP